MKYQVVLIDAEKSDQPSREALAHRLSQRFHLNEKQLAADMKQLPLVMKQGLTREQAAALGKALKTCGALVEVLEDNSAEQDNKIELQSTEPSAPSLQILEFDKGDLSAEPSCNQAPAGSSKLDSGGLSFETSEQQPSPAGEAAGGSSELLFENIDSSDTDATSVKGLLEQASAKKPPGMHHAPAAQALESPTEQTRDASQSSMQGETFGTTIHSSAIQVPAARPKRRTRRIQWAIAGMLLLMGILYTVQRTQVRVQRTVITDDSIRQMLAQQKVMLSSHGKGGKSDSASPAKAAAANFAGLTSADGVSCKASLSIADDKVTHLSLEISTDEPPKVTDEEFAQGKRQQPWMRRMEIVAPPSKISTTPHTAETGQTFRFEASVLARGYYRDSKGNERILADALVSGTFSAASPVVSGTYRVLFGETQAAEGPHIVAKRAEDGKVKISLFGSFSATRQEEQSPSQVKTTSETTSKQGAEAAGSGRTK